MALPARWVPGVKVLVAKMLIGFSWGEAIGGVEGGGIQE
jgi:hypothetical protein